MNIVFSYIQDKDNLLIKTKVVFNDNKNMIAEMNLTIDELINIKKLIEKFLIDNEKFMEERKKFIEKT